MADDPDLTYFLLTGRESAVVADTDDALTNPDKYEVWVPVTITARPEVFRLTSTTPPKTKRIRPIQARIETGVLKLPGGVPDEGVRLPAKTSVLGLGDAPLLYDVAYGKGKINGVEVDFRDQNFTFAAPESDTPRDLTTVARVSPDTSVPPGQLAEGPPGQDGNSLSQIHRVGNTIVGQVNGVDIPNPIDISDWVAPDTYGTVFSTAAYSPVSGDDRPRVQAAVDAAVAAMTADDCDQVVLIHAPMNFTTGAVWGPLASTLDPVNVAVGNNGVGLPCNLEHTLHIVFAPGARINLGSDGTFTTPQNAFYIDKVADYDVFQNVSFYDAWVDANYMPAGGNRHILVGNGLYPGGYVIYLSFQNINFFGKTRVTRVYHSDTLEVSGGYDLRGQGGIAFVGAHLGPLEATQTFAKNIYLEDGYQEGGAKLIEVLANGYHEGGGTNHYHDNIVIGRWRHVNPSTPIETDSETSIYLGGSGFGDYCYVGPGYSENVGDDAIEISSMQRVEVHSPHFKNPRIIGLLLRNTHALIDRDNQHILIRDLECDVDSDLLKFHSPICLWVTNTDIVLTSTASGGSGTLTIPGIGTTSSLNWNATAGQVQTAVRALTSTAAYATGGPLNTTPITVHIPDTGRPSGPVTVNSSFTGGGVTVSLADAHAGFGTVTIEDPVIRMDGQTYSDSFALYPDYPDGMIVHGCDVAHKRINIIRPRIVITDYTYDDAADGPYLSMVRAAAPYPGFGHVVIEDWDFKLSGDFGAGSGFGYPVEVMVAGDGTLVEIDGMTSDRSAAVDAPYVIQVLAGYQGTNTRTIARRLNPRGLSATASNRGVRVQSTGTVARFDVFDSDFSQGTNNFANALHIANAGSNAAVVRTGRNTYPDAPAGATITPSGSPFTWQNTLGVTAVVQISGGVVSQVQYSPLGGSFRTSQFVSGSWTVEPGASVKVTYTSAPTMSYDLGGGGGGTDLAVSTGSLLPVRAAAEAGATYTIASGNVTQISGTTVNGVSINVGDRILVLGAPASTGAGSSHTTQPGNGIYVCTSNTTNLSLVRAQDFSGSVVPWGQSVYVREGTNWGGYIAYFNGTGAFTWGTTAFGYTNYFYTQGDYATLTGTETLTSKRITKRVVTQTSTATPTPTADTADIWHLTTLTVTAAFAAPSGTPTDGQPLRIRVTSAAAQTLSWNSIYVPNGITALPLTSVAGKTITMDFQYASAPAKWILMAVDAAGY